MPLPLGFDPETDDPVADILGMSDPLLRGVSQRTLTETEPPPPIPTGIVQPPQFESPIEQQPGPAPALPAPSAPTTPAVPSGVDPAGEVLGMADPSRPPIPSMSGGAGGVAAAGLGPDDPVASILGQTDPGRIPRAPTPKSGVASIGSTLADIGVGISSSVVDVFPEFMARFYRASGPQFDGPASRLDAFIAEQKADQERKRLSPEEAAQRTWLFGLTRGGIREGLAQFGNSVPSMVLGTIGRIAGTAVGGALGIETGPGAIATAYAGAVAGGMLGMAPMYWMKKDQVIEDALAKAREENPNLTRREWERMLPEIEKVASEAAWNEVLPEMATAGIQQGLLKWIGRAPGVGKLIARVGESAIADALLEIGGEAVTEKLDANTLAKLGMDEPITWGEAVQRVWEPTLVMSLFSMGIGTVGTRIEKGRYNRFASKSIAAMEESGISESIINDFRDAKGADEWAAVENRHAEAIIRHVVNDVARATVNNDAAQRATAEADARLGGAGAEMQMEDAAAGVSFEDRQARAMAYVDSEMQAGRDVPDSVAERIQNAQNHEDLAAAAQELRAFRGQQRATAQATGAPVQPSHDPLAARPGSVEDQINRLVNQRVTEYSKPIPSNDELEELKQRLMGLGPWSPAHEQAFISGRPYPDAAGAAQMPRNAPASVPVMITQEMRRELGVLGFTPGQIDRMRPAEANQVLQDARARQQQQGGQPQQSGAKPAVSLVDQIVQQRAANGLSPLGPKALDYLRMRESGLIRGKLTPDVVLAFGTIENAAQSIPRQHRDAAPEAPAAAGAQPAARTAAAQILEHVDLGGNRVDSAGDPDVALRIRFAARDRGAGLPGFYSGLNRAVESSRTGARRGGISVQQASTAIADVAGKLGFEVRVVKNLDALSDADKANIGRAMRAQGVSGARGIFMPDGRVILLADNIETPAEAVQILVHETFERGFANLPKAETTAILNDIFKGSLNRKAIYEQATARVKKNYRNLATTEALQSPEGRAAFMREVLAHIAENRTQMPTLWQRVVRAIQNALIRLTKGTALEGTFGDANTAQIETLIDRALSRGAAPTIGSQSAPNFQALEVTPDEAARLGAEADRQIADGGLKAPNGNPSKLNRTQWIQVRSENFKKWFGDWENDPVNASRVIDPETGEPMVVYHGTRRNFSAFDSARLGDATAHRTAKAGFYFTSSADVAGIFGGRDWDWGEQKWAFLPGSNIVPVFLNLKNATPIKARRFVDQYIKGSESVVQDIGATDGAIVSGDAEVGDTLGGEEYAHDFFIVRNPRNVKSATGNVGAFGQRPITEAEAKKLGMTVEEANAAQEAGDIRFAARDNSAPDSPESFERRLDDLTQKLAAARSRAERETIKRQRAEETIEYLRQQADNIVKAQKGLVAYMRRARIPQAERANMITRLTDLAKFKTRDALARHYRAAIAEVDRISDWHEGREIREQIGELLAANAVKLSRKFPTGTRTPETYRTIAQIREIAGMSREQLTRELEAMEARANAAGAENIAYAALSDEDAARQALLNTFAGVMLNRQGEAWRTHEETQAALEELERLVREGMTGYQAKQAAFRAETEALRSDAINIVTGGRGLKPQPKRFGQERTRKTFMDKLRSFATLHLSWEWLLDYISSNDRGSKQLESGLQVHARDAKAAADAEARGIQARVEEIQAASERIFGVKGRALTKRMQENSRVVKETGVFVGGEQLSLSQNEAYHLWQMYFQPNLQVQDKDGVTILQKLGWTEEVRDQLEAFMKPEVKQWAEWQMREFYENEYHRINEVFRDLYSADLPHNPNYAPAPREYTSSRDADNLLGHEQRRATVFTGSLLNRVENLRNLKIVDGDQLLMQHVFEMEHFISHGRLMRKLRATIGHQDVLTAIEHYYPEGAATRVRRFMNAFARGGEEKSAALGLIQKMRRNFQQAVISSPTTMLKQFASIPYMALEVPSGDFASGFAWIMRQPWKAFGLFREIMNESAMMQDRYGSGWERDFRLAMMRTVPKRLGGIKTIADAAGIFTAIGDKGAAFFGGIPVYRYHLKKNLAAGMSEADAKAEALKAFENAVERTQQSGRTIHLGEIQRDPVGSMFTMFMTQLTAIFRYTLGAIRNYKAGRMTARQAARQIFVANVLGPAVFGFVSAGLRWGIGGDDDDDDTLTVGGMPKEVALQVLTSPFQGLVLAAPIAEAIARNVTYGYTLGDGIGSDLLPWTDTMDSFVGVATKTFKSFEGGDIDPETAGKAFDDLLELAGKATGIPIDPVRRSVTGAMAAIEGDTDYPIRRMIGFSKYTLGEGRTAKTPTGPRLPKLPKVPSVRR